MANTEQEVKQILDSDPFIKKLMAPEGSKDSNTGYYLNVRPNENELRWIDIATNSDKTSSEKNTSMQFLSVRNYTAVESKEIYQALISGRGNLNFNKKGHIKINSMVLKNSIMEFSTNIQEFNNSNKLINFSTSTAAPNIYFYSENIVFSPNLKWILYKIPSKKYSDLSDTATEIMTDYTDNSRPIYVLLYNTVQRPNFRDLYVKMSNDNSYVSLPNKNYVSGGIQFDYNTLISKYCNGFTVKKGYRNGKKVDHYSDPSCTISLEDQFAIYTNNIIGMNITYPFARDHYYIGGVSEYEAILTKFSQYQKDNVYCHGRVNQSTTLKFLEVNGLAVNPQTVVESESFINPLVNKQRRGFIDGGGVLNNSLDYLIRNGVKCENRDVINMTCLNTIQSGGNIDLSDANNGNDCTVNVNSGTETIAEDDEVVVEDDEDPVVDVVNDPVDDPEERPELDLDLVGIFDDEVEADEQDYTMIILISVVVLLLLLLLLLVYFILK